MEKCFYVYPGYREHVSVTERDGGQYRFEENTPDREKERCVIINGMKHPRRTGDE